MSNVEELQYLDLLDSLLSNGTEKTNRTGVGTYSKFGDQLRFDLKKGFPLLTTKKMITRSIFFELAWFLRGDTNIKFLNDNGVHIWDEWADENGDLGPVYGKQWRDWKGPNGEKVDQIVNLINGLQNNPDSRRHIVCAWNPGEVNKMHLPPCHALFQFYVADNKLSCQLYQRSADVFLGVPFNLASYALLTHLVAQTVELDVGDFVHSFGDVHLYKNHADQAKTQLSRTPYEFPTLKLNENTDVFHFDPDKDITLENYNYHPAIKAPIAV